MTATELNAEDVLDLQVAKAATPKPVGKANVPSLLYDLQGEWDAVMLEVSTLRRDLETTRKELSTALYSLDAAC